MNMNDAFLGSLIFNKGGEPGGGGNYTDEVWDGSIIQNTFINRDNGVEESYDGWSSTDYLDLADSSKLYRCGRISVCNYNAFYTENKTFISGFYDNSIQSIPANARYARISGVTSDLTGKMFIEV